MLGWIQSIRFFFTPSVYTPTITTTLLNLSSGLPQTPTLVYVCASQDKSVIYVSTGNDYLLKSSNGGSTWSTITSTVFPTWPGAATRIQQVACNNDGSLVGFVTNNTSTKYFYFSTNGGSSWTRGQGFTYQSTWLGYCMSFSHVLLGAAGSLLTTVCNNFVGTTRTQFFTTNQISNVTGQPWFGVTFTGLMQQYQPSNDGSRYYNVCGLTSTTNSNNRPYVSVYSSSIVSSPTTHTLYPLTGIPVLAFPDYYRGIAINMNSNKYVLAMSTSKLALCSNADLLNSSTGVVLSDFAPFTDRTNTFMWVSVSYSGKCMCALTTTGFYVSIDFGVKWFYFSLSNSIVWDTCQSVYSSTTENEFFITGHVNNNSYLYLVKIT